MRFFSYKLTHDDGLAPNPFWEFLTLAVCKPEIRENRNIGDWIAGFSSKELDSSCEIGKEKLIYLMKVTGKIPFSKYWNNPKYDIKKPDLASSDLRKHVGDNIYKPVRMEYEQVPNVRHCSSDMDKDLKSKQVLLSDEFYYFGASAIELPDDIRPKIPFGQSSNGYETTDVQCINNLLKYVSNNYRTGMIDYPTSWGRKTQI